MLMTVVDTAVCRGGENPLWDGETQRLYFVDNIGRKAHRHDPGTGMTTSWDFDASITTLALRKGGGAVITLRSGLHYFDFETEALDMILPLPEGSPIVFNDGKVDRRGRFLIGASTSQFDNPVNDGGLFRMDPDGTVRQIDGDIHFSNGPCFAPDDRTLYFADSWRKTIYAYDYDIATGDIGNRRPFVDTNALDGLPDGATVDAEGNLWVAIYGGAKVVCFGPDGSLRRTIDMPVKLVSSVMFGGPDLDQLYVTTIAHGAMGEPVEEGAGAVYRIDGLGVKGLPEPRFGG